MIAVMALLPCGQGGQGLFEDLQKSSKSTRPLSGFARNVTIFRTEGNGFLCRQPISYILEQRDCAFDPSFASSCEQSMARLRACRSTRCCEEPVSGVQGCQLLQKTQCTTFYDAGRADCRCHSLVHSVWWYVGDSLRSCTSGRVQQMFIRT